MTTNITNLLALQYMKPRRAEREGCLTAILTRRRLYLRWHVSRHAPIRNILGEKFASLTTFDPKPTPQTSLFKFLRAHRPCWFELYKWHVRNMGKNRTPSI